MKQSVARTFGALLLVVASGCRGRVPEISYQDLLAPGGLGAAHPTEKNPGQASCGDEAGWLLSVAPDQRLATTIHAGAARRLELSLCAPPAKGAHRARPCLDLGLGGETHRLCAVEDEWATQSFGIAGTGDLELEISGGRRAVLLRDVRVRSERAVTRRTLSGPPGRQILLISVDTLRSDALSVPGGPFPTPNLDEFARRGQVFRRHYAGASWTRPSHATLLTGIPAFLHGATDLTSGIRDGVPTLAERFHAAGFATEANVRAILNLDPRWGFARGFESYVTSEALAGSTTRLVLQRLEALRDRPFFYFLHLFEAHSDFAALPYESDGFTRKRLEREFGIPDYGCREGRCASNLLKAIDNGTLAPTSADRLLLPALYRRGVREIDARLGALFEELKATGLWDPLTIVLTSDHGESLLEHGHTLHTVYFEPVIRVPLIVKWPRGLGKTVPAELLTSPTTSLDLAPTLLETAGLPAGDLPGRSLLRDPGRRVITAGPALDIVIEGEWKALWNASGAPRVYDLAADPGELEDLAVRRPDRVEYLTRLRTRLREQFSRLGIGGARKTGELSDDDVRKLRSLGYIN